MSARENIYGKTGTMEEIRPGAVDTRQGSFRWLNSGLVGFGSQLRFSSFAVSSRRMVTQSIKDAKGDFLHFSGSAKVSELVSLSSAAVSADGGA